jgi:hypothetical protein
MALEHRLLIFVYRRRAAGLEYFFERRHPTLEFGWTPIASELAPSESFETAVRRSMEHEWHAPPPDQLLDLKVCGHFCVGDVDLVDWGVGYGVRVGWDPQQAPRSARADLRWSPLPVALEMLEGESARRALFRLHVAAAG